MESYKNLSTYILATVIFDLTVEFCRRWIDPRSRTTDQMTQAARSGKQNIAEGASVQSLESYIKLLGVTEGSQRELAADYEDFLRQRKLSIWDKEDSRVREIRRFRAVWVSPNQPNTPNLPNSPEIAANTLLTFCQMETFLLKRQIEALKEKFVREGGFRENLFAKRLAFRRNSTPLTNLTRLTKLILVILVLLGMTTKSAFATNTGPFSVELWVYPTTSAATKALVAKAEELRLVTDASGNPACQIMVSSSWQTAATSSVALSLNTWNHVSCTYDKVTIRVFVNGIQTAQTAQTSPPDDTANVFRIGQDDSASTTYTNFTGTVDDFKFYNYVRSQKQTVEDMAGGHPAVTNQSIVGWWKFDEGADNMCSGGVNDACNSGSGGSALDGAQSGMAVPATATSGWTNAGKFGKALAFDGTNDYVSAGSTSLLAPPENMSISAWVKTSTSPSGDLVIAGKSGSTVSQYQLRLTGPADGTGKLKFSHYNSSTTTWYQAISSSTYNDGLWHHVLGINKDGQLYLYVDGVQVANTSVTWSTAGSGNFSIGSRDNTDLFFNGLIDEVKIYNYALTSDEIKLDYNRGSTLVLGSLGDNSSYQKQAANQEYCVPGDTTSCASPVGEWKFDEGNGLSALDTSGNGNTGTLTNGPVWSAGKYGKGLTFDGTNDFVRVTDPASGILDFGAAQDFTIGVWLKTTNVPASNAWPMILNKEVAASRTGYNLYLTASGNGVVGFDNYSAGVASGGVFSATRVNDGKWHYVTAIRNGTTLQMYIDGKMEGNVTGVTSVDLSTAVNLSIGMGRDGTQYPFPVAIDNVKIYNYARTQAQVAWDYNRSGPVAWYKFDECTGATANDASGNGNNGTITIGASGTQTSTGTCGTSTTTEAWNNGTTGKRNASINLDGNDDYVTTAAFSPLADSGQSTSKASWGGWFYPTSSAASLTLMEKVSEFRLTTDANSKPLCGINTGPTLTLQPDATAGVDTQLVNNSGVTKNYGVTTSFGAGINAATIRRLLIAFDISSIPSNATINFATLTLTSTFANATGSYNVEAHRALTQWFEGVKNGVAPDAGQDGSIWNYRNANGSVAWGAAGGLSGTDFTGTATATVSVTGSVGSAYNWNVLSDVSAWVSGSATNYGLWLINTDEASTNSLESFAPSDYTAVIRFRPKLTVIYNTSFHDTDAGSTALTTSAWNHVMCTYDGANIKTYLNGSLVATTVDTTVLTAASSILYMGENSSGAQRMTGQLDDLRVYNNALTASQIKTLMNEGAIRFGPATGSP